eukprot:4923293-Karenia_brevis.AAC.1
MALPGPGTGLGLASLHLVCSALSATAFSAMSPPPAPMVFPPLSGGRFVRLLVPSESCFSVSCACGWPRA